MNQSTSDLSGAIREAERRFPDYRAKRKTKMLDSLVSRTKGQTSTADLLIELSCVLTELETRENELIAMGEQLPELLQRLRRLQARAEAKSATENPFVRSLRE